MRFFHYDFLIVFNYILEATHQPFPSIGQPSSQAADAHLHRSFETKTSAPLKNVAEQVQNCWSNGQTKTH